MAISHIKLTYEVPVGDELDVLINILSMNSTVQELCKKTDMWRTRELIKPTLKGTFNKKYIESRRDSNRSAIIYSGTNTGRYASIFVHECEANMGYNFTEETFRNGLLGFIAWDYGHMNLTTMFPTSLFQNAKVTDMIDYSKQNDGFRRFRSIVDMKYSRDSGDPVQQPYAGLIQCNPIRTEYEDGDPRKRIYYTFFGQFSASDILIIDHLERWHANIVDFMWRELIHEEGGNLLLREVLKSVH